MKTERPILFSAPMIRALRAGTKTQTRRVVKDTGLYAIDAAIHGPETAARELLALATRCPYGQPGDRLWVREAWRTTSAWDRTPPRDLPGGVDLHYEADGRPNAHFCFGKLRPGMFMVRGASRITLEVSAVRVERLQAISRGDAMAEGCPFANMAAGPDPRDWYRDLWNEINGPGAWDLSPWVWVVAFKVVKP